MFPSSARGQGRRACRFMATPADSEPVDNLIQVQIPHKSYPEQYSPSVSLARFAQIHFFSPHFPPTWAQDASSSDPSPLASCAQTNPGAERRSGPPRHPLQTPLGRAGVEQGSQELLQPCQSLFPRRARPWGPVPDLSLPSDEVARRVWRSPSNGVLEIINQRGFVGVITLNKEGAEWSQLNGT